MSSGLPDLIIDVAATLFERRLTDISGGNISARDGDRMFITPRYAGSRQLWDLSVDDIMSAAIDDDGFLDHPRCSRESRIHLGIYRSFPEVTGIIHAHPYHALPFCVAERPIEMVLESTQHFGPIELVAAAAANSQILADNVVRGLQEKRAAIAQQAGAVLLPRHGIVVAGLDLAATADATERIEWNAWCILAQKLIPEIPVGYRFG